MSSAKWNNTIKICLYDLSINKKQLSKIKQPFSMAHALLGYLSTDFWFLELQQKEN